MIPLRVNQPTSTFPIVTVLIIAVNVVVYLAQVASQGAIDASFSMVPYEVTHNVDLAGRALRDPQGQVIAARNYYRPTQPEGVPAALLAQFPEVKLVTIDGAFGGWKKAQAEHFGDGGIFDQIYKPAK